MKYIVFSLKHILMWTRTCHCHTKENLKKSYLCKIYYKNAPYRLLDYLSRLNKCDNLIYTNLVWSAIFVGPGRMRSAECGVNANSRPAHICWSARGHNEALLTPSC